MSGDEHSLYLRKVWHGAYGLHHALACYLPVSVDMFVVLDVSKAITNCACSNLYVCGTFAVAPEIAEMRLRDPPTLR